MFKINYEITEVELEQSYNHVDHTRSLVLLEIARLRYIESIGFPNTLLFARNLFLVVTRIEVDYDREIKLGLVTLTCENPDCRGKVLLLTQRIINAKEKDAVTAHLRFQIISGETQRSVPIPEDFRAAFVALGRS